MTKPKKRRAIPRHTLNTINVNMLREDLKLAKHLLADGVIRRSKAPLRRCYAVLIHAEQRLDMLIE